MSLCTGEYAKYADVTAERWLFDVQKFDRMVSPSSHSKYLSQGLSTSTRQDYVMVAD